MKKQRRLRLSSLLLAILVGVVSQLFYSCGGTSAEEKEVNETNVSTETFNVGEFAYLIDNCVGVVDTDDWSTVLAFVKANDMRGIQDLVVQGKAVTFAGGKQVKVIENGFEFVQVRDVGATESLVWVPRNMLTHEDVWGVSQTQ